LWMRMGWSNDSAPAVKRLPRNGRSCTVDRQTVWEEMYSEISDDY
jgi:hypothetical protein